MAIIKQGATFTIGGDRPVRRMGFGAMQLTGPGVWGPPVDRANAFSVLRRAIELGANFIDTADVYGPGDNERLIRAALTPYPSDLVIATKAGLVRTGPATQEAHGTSMNGAEAHIRQAAQSSLRDLGLQSIDLYQLHRVDPATPIEETLRAFRALQEAGQIRHIGLSEVGLEDLERARRVVPIATVQNVYNLENRKHEAVLAYCEHHGIGFIPFWPQHRRFAPFERSCSDRPGDPGYGASGRVGVAAEEVSGDDPDSWDLFAFAFGREHGGLRS